MWIRVHCACTPLASCPPALQIHARPSQYLSSLAVYACLHLGIRHVLSTDTLAGAKTFMSISNRQSGIISFERTHATLGHVFGRHGPTASCKCDFARVIICVSHCAIQSPKVVQKSGHFFSRINTTSQHAAECMCTCGAAAFHVGTCFMQCASPPSACQNRQKHGSANAVAPGVCEGARSRRQVRLHSCRAPLPCRPLRR